MGLTTRLFGHATRSLGRAAKDALDPDRVLQAGMAALIEARRDEHAQHPARSWRRGEPLSLLLAGYVGTRNTGADVRVEEMIRQFRHLFGDEHLDLSILTIDPSLTRGYFRTVKQVEVPQIFPPFLHTEVAKHHGVIACEGSMFKSKFASALTTMMVGALGLALAEDKLAVGYGGEAGAMDPSLEAMVRKYVQGALILTRNAESSAMLDRLGVASKPGTDTAWTYADPPHERARTLLTRAGWDGRTPVLTVCPIHPFWWPVRPDPWKAAARGLTGAYGASHFRSVYFHADGPDVERRLRTYLAGLAGAVRDFRGETACFPVIVGMEALDRGACERLREELGGETPCFVSDAHEHAELVGLLRASRYLVTSRYHAAVCSMPAGVPSLGVTMDERLRNLMADRGQPELCLGVDDEGLDARVLAGLRRLRDDEDAVRRGIERSVAANLRRMGEMGAHLVDHVRAAHPRFPLRAGLGAGGDPWLHLPALDAPQRRILEAHA